MEEDGWIAHTGGECPAPADTLVKIKFREYCEKGYLHDEGWSRAPEPASSLDWRHSNDWGDIISYKVYPSKPTE